jgi:hypothetical protein
LAKGLLNQYVKSIIYVEGNNKGIGFPKAAMSLVFNLQDSFKLSTDEGFTNYQDYKKYWVAGLQTQPRYVENYGHSKMIVVQFRALGAYRLLKQPLYHFTDNYVPWTVYGGTMRRWYGNSFSALHRSHKW